MPAPKNFTHITRTRSAYEPFMKDPDGRVIAEAASGTSFEAAAEDLLAAWRGVHYARGVPWLLAQAGPKAAAGALKREGPRLPEAEMLQFILGKLGPIRLNGKARRDLSRIIREAYQELDQRLDQAKQVEPGDVEFDAVWAQYVQLVPFRQALEASETSAFLNLYFAYENFLARCIETREGQWPTSTTKIGSQFKRTFGEELWRKCWAEGPVAAARHARDAFAHRGGRVNTETPVHSASLEVGRGFILISAENTNWLYRELRDRYLAFMRAQAAGGTSP